MEPEDIAQSFRILRKCQNNRTEGGSQLFETQKREGS